MKRVFQKTPIFLVLLLFACRNIEQEKSNAFDQVVTENILFTDTLMRYSLYSDSVTFEFVKPLKHKDWVGEVAIYSDTAMFFVDQKKEKDSSGMLGPVNFINGRVTFRHFHIPKELLNKYDVHFRAIPVFPGCSARGEIYSPAYLFIRNKNNPGLLSPSEMINDFTIVKFDLVKLKKLSPELQRACRDSIKKSFHTEFTDIEIESSTYSH